MPTKPKQQRVVNQERFEADIADAFAQWCALNRRAHDEAAMLEFTQDMDGTFAGKSRAEILAILRHRTG